MTEGLYLDDEQAKALREWWLHFHDMDWVPDSAPDRLVRAIAPLMKPWHMAPYEFGWMLTSGLTEIYVSPNSDWSRETRQEMATVVLDLLNEMETRCRPK